MSLTEQRDLLRTVSRAWARPLDSESSKIVFFLLSFPDPLVNLLGEACPWCQVAGRELAVASYGSEWPQVRPLVPPVSVGMAFGLSIMAQSDHRRQVPLVYRHQQSARLREGLKRV